MLIVLAVLAASLPAPQHPVAGPWQAALDRLAPHLAGFRASGRNPGANGRRLDRLLTRLRLNPRHDARTHKDVPGLWVWPEEGVLPVAGASGATYALISWGSMDQIKDAPDDSWRILFRPVHRRRRRSAMVAEFVDRGTVLPRYVALTGRTLAVSGLEDYWTNEAHVALECYRKDNGGWQDCGTKIAECESWDPPPLRLAGNGRTILPVRFSSRTYPERLSACHATADLTYEEEWAIRSGKPKFVWRRLRDTPFNTLDRLYDAICESDTSTIRRHSLNPSLARRIGALHSRTYVGTPEIRFPNSVSDPEGRVIGVENLRTTFHFARRRGRWVVTRLGPASESE